MRRHPRWWLKHVALSMLIGIVVSAGFVLYWERGYAESSISILGSGDGLSTLIQFDGTRILVVSGDDPSEFANALADARPAHSPRIDLVIVTPGAYRVATRAIEIIEPAEVLVLDRPTFSDEIEDWTTSTTRVSAISTIVINDRARLELDPGNSVNSANAGWTVRVRGGDTDVLVSERAPMATLTSIDVFVIAGAEPGPILPTESYRFVSSTVQIATTAKAYKIGPGETTRIELND